MSKKIELSKEVLSNLYRQEKLTTYQIAKKMGCCQATIWKKLVKFKIKLRKPRELNSHVPSKKELIKFYLKQKLSTWEIEKRYGYSRGTVHRKLKEFGLETRDRADSHILYPRTNFSGNLPEKAYLVGFRMGDLGVRKIYPNSKTICVASGSTIKEQIDLIENLFKGYGMVRIKTTKSNKTNIWVALNESFDFLLENRFPKWVLQNRKTFFSFLAGFTDAEGTISQNRNLDYYSLGNYDSKTLFLIFKNLNKFGIFCNSPIRDNRKGKANSQGYIYQNNYWSIRITRKKDLLKLLLELKPYIRHEHKIKALNIAISNIKLRNKLFGERK